MITVDPRRPNPFPGLRPFRSDEHHLFFGREEQTAALLQLLRTNRFLAVVGTSGSGKSSLVRAGMIAELHGGTMTKAGSTWEVMLLRPGGSPIENLARAFVDADLYPAEDPSTLPRLLATLNRSRFGLVEAMKQSEVFEPGTNLLVVVDQFEELFRFRQQGVDSEETAAAFVNLLLTASEQAECPIYVTITMRSDYLGDCSEIPGLAEAVNEGEYLIPRLLRDQKRDAIEKPIGVGGAKISPLLVQRLLNEVGDDPDQLPVMQHALMRMWDSWSTRSVNNRPIDFADFEATGGLGAALSNHADEVYDSLPDDRHRSACAKIFKTLTVKGDDNPGIRRPTRFAHLQAIAASDRDTVTTVLDAFRGSGVTFLMPGTEVALGDRTVLDLSHESLMRGWQRLRGWVEEEAQSARVFRRLLDTARLWSDAKAGLFRDPDLQIALTWREQQVPNAVWAEQYGGHFEKANAFLEASNAEAQAERQAKEAARQRELEQAQELAESRKQRLIQQQRAAKRLRILLAGLAVVAVIAGVACVAALMARNEASRLATLAQQEADNARQSQQETQNALAVVESQKVKAEAAEKEAQRAEKRSREFRYATDMQLAARLIDDQHANARQVLDRLADQDPAKTQDLKGKEDLRGFEWYCLKRLVDSQAAIFRGSGRLVVDSALSAEGELVTLDDDGRLQRWDTKARRETRPALDLRKGRNLGFMALSVDGRKVALAIENKVHLFDTATGEEAIPAIPATAHFGLIFSPDNRMLITVDSSVGWWNAATGQSIASQESKLNVPGPLSISSDGLTLAVGGQAGSYTASSFSVFRMNPDARKVTVLLDKHAANMGSTRAAVLSPDGSQLAVSQYFSGNVVLFDTSTGQSVKGRILDHTASVSAMAFNPLGNELVTASLDGSIKVWPDYKGRDSAKTTPSQTTGLMGHIEEVTRVAFAAGGRRLISSSRDKTTRIWDLARRTPSLHQTVDDLRTARARFSPDGLLIAAAEVGNVRLRDSATGRLVRELPAPADEAVNRNPGFPSSVAFSPDNRWLAVGYGGQNDVSHVELWDIDRGDRFAVLPGTTDIPNFTTYAVNGIVSALRFSPDGKFLVAGFGSLNSLPRGKIGRHPIKVYDVATRRTLRLLEGHESFSTSLAFSPDGSRMASGSYDGTARIWDTSTWKTLHVLENPDPLTPKGYKRIVDVAFSPAGDLLAVASHEGNPHVWNAATGAFLQTLKGHANGVTSVAFSSDGHTLASGSDDNTIRLWNVATWREVMRLDPGATFFPRSLAFSPDDTQLLAAAYPAVILWSTRPDDGGQPDQTARRLAALLESKADFTSRIRMLSESPRLDEALEILRGQRPDDARVQEALAAARATGHASRQQWKQAAEAFDELKTIPPHQPEAWFRTPGLLRLATALLHENRPADAAELLTGGAKRRTEDGLPPVGRTSPELLVASCAFIPPPSSLIPSVVAGLTNEGFINDPATGERLYPLLAAVNERLAKEPRNAGLLQLRAELAGQWSDWKAQAADYTAAIEILATQPAPSPLSTKEGERGRGEGAASAHLQRLHRRRGDAYVAMQKWPEAVDDYAHVITPETTDALLLSNRARAHEGLKSWDAAAADWARAATGRQEGARWLAEFARRLAAEGQVSVAKAQFEKSQALYERVLEADPESVLVAAELAQVLWHKPENDKVTQWTVLTPTEMKSKGGATLSKLPDDSILASGKNSLGDAYTIVAQTKVTQISAIRLEALTHESLPNQGPGRDEQKNRGTFAMVKFTIRAHVPGSQPREIEVSRVAADQFILDLSANHWNIGDSSRPRTAVYLAKQPVDCNDEVRLEFQMEFSASAEWPLQNLGRFRLSVSSDPAEFDRQRKRFAAMKLTDPWAKLAAAYHVLGDHQALDKLLKHHPAAAAGIGDVYAAVEDWEPAIAEYDKVITSQPADGNLLTKLFTAYQSAGRTREGVAHLAAADAAKPEDTFLVMRVTALQAWFGQDKAFADTSRRRLEWAKNTTIPETADRVAKACCLLPSADNAHAEAALALAHKAVDLGKDNPNLPYFQMVLGMAEYRSGHFAKADAALLSASQRGKDNPHIAGTSAFYRAMCLLRQGTEAEARKLAITAAAKMKPLPKDEKNPVAGDANPDDLILWLASKEAMTLLEIKLSPIELLEEARNDEVKTLGADHQTTLATTNKLADAYLTSGRTRDAVPLLVTVSVANPSDTILSLKVAALQAWFGQEKELAATRSRILAFAKDTKKEGPADHGAKACSILASTDKAELEAALALGRKGVELGKGGQYWDWDLMALGMAEYRSGNDAAAVEALLACAKAGPDNAIATGVAAFYRAMSLFRQGKHDEARKLAIEAAAKMKPLPNDEQNPLPINANPWDDLILWLAYKEAKAMIKFEAPPPPKGKNDKK